MNGMSRTPAGGYGSNVGNHPYAAGATYGANHSDWYHGGWNGNYGGVGGYGMRGYGYGVPGYGYGVGGYGMGYGMAGYGYGMGGYGLYGLSPWAYGSQIYNMGYTGYANPYNNGATIASARFTEGSTGTGATLAAARFTEGGSGTPSSQAAPYDYSQPINSPPPPPQQSATQEAQGAFDQSRAAFKSGDYAHARSLCDKALQKLPDDPRIHEFRALVLFALKRYEESSATLYNVLSAGPGWDWTTMIGLYPSVDVYTAQIRSLESYSRANPKSAAAHFVLGYQYLVQGHNDVAAGQFRRVVALEPNDTLSAKLAEMFSKKDPNDSPTSPTNTPPAKTFELVGTWLASPAKDVTIKLNIQKDGPFTWNVVDKGKPRELKGTSAYANNLLTLDGSQGQPLVGQVTWQDENHFKFQVGGGGPLDPGLSFSR
jgi:tetratricopeptide (TPR) repeat protein